jgi:hypothetical protein
MLFWVLRLHKMSSHDLSTPRNIASKSSFKTSSRNVYEFSRPFAYLKHHFWDFEQTAFLNGLSTPWNFVSSTSTKLFLKLPEGKLWVLRVIRLLKTSLKQLHQSRFFRYSWCRKCLRMGFRHLETSLHLFKPKSFYKTSPGQVIVSQGHSRN